MQQGVTALESLTLAVEPLTCAETPMLEDAEEGGVRLWHLVKASEEPELPKHRRGSLRERERAKAIPEIYLTRLLSMKVHTEVSSQCRFWGLDGTCRYPTPSARSSAADHFDSSSSMFSRARCRSLWTTCLR